MKARYQNERNPIATIAGARYGNRMLQARPLNALAEIIHVLLPKHTKARTYCDGRDRKSVV